MIAQRSQKFEAVDELSSPAASLLKQPGIERLLRNAVPQIADTNSRECLLVNQRVNRFASNAQKFHHFLYGTAAPF